MESSLSIRVWKIILKPSSESGLAMDIGLMFLCTTLHKRFLHGKVLGI
jgi:hypothetical protein